MAFCTACGASVNGAFCSRCGAPAPQSAAGAGPATAAAPAPAPARRRTNPLVWVLIVILAFCALAIFGMMGAGYFLARRGPGYAIAKIIAATHPDTEVVRTDDGAGTITLRDRRSGKTVTLSFDEARRGRFRLDAEDENGKRASFELGGSATPPSWIPKYPGSHPRPVFSASGESDNNAGEAGSFMFTTPDPPARVKSFYEGEARRLGMNVHVRTEEPGAGVLVLKDSDEQRTLSVATESSDGGTTVNITYGRKR